MGLKIVGSLLFAIGFFGGVLNLLADSKTSGWWWWGLFFVGLVLFVAARFQDAERGSA